MHRHDEADAGEGRSPVGGLPDREQGAGEKDDPTDHGNGDNRELNPEDAVLNEPVTRAERFAFWTLVATAGLAFATFVLAIATADMARSTRQLAGFAKQQAHDTQDALDAARRQALAAETANKLVNAPQVSVSTVTLNVPNQDAKNTASFAVFDVGRVPASELQGQAELVVMPPPQLPASLGPCPTCPKAILFPSQGFQGSGLTFTGELPKEQFTKDVVDSIKAGTRFIYLVGRVDFVYPDKSRHKILICNVYRTQISVGGPCDAGNEAD